MVDSEAPKTGSIAIVSVQIQLFVPIYFRYLFIFLRDDIDRIYSKCRALRFS